MACLSDCLSTLCLSVCVSVWWPVCLSVCLSVCLILILPIVIYFCSTLIFYARSAVYSFSHSLLFPFPSFNSYYHSMIFFFFYSFSETEGWLQTRRLRFRSSWPLFIPLFFRYWSNWRKTYQRREDYKSQVRHGIMRGKYLYIINFFWCHVFILSSFSCYFNYLI